MHNDHIELLKLLPTLGQSLDREECGGGLAVLERSDPLSIG